MKSQKGFTFIELLIVIVILGVLATAIIPNLNRFMNHGPESIELVDPIEYESYYVTQHLHWGGFDTGMVQILQEHYPTMEDMDIVINVDGTVDITFRYRPEKIVIEGK